MPAQNSAPWLKSQSCTARGSSGGKRTVRSAPATMPSATASSHASADSSSVVSRPWSSQRPDSPVQSTLHLNVYCRLFPDLLQQIRLHLGRHRVWELSLGSEPLVVDLEVLARLEAVLEPGVDGGLELGVALTHSHAVRLLGVEVADDVPVVRIRRFRLQAV